MMSAEIEYSVKGFAVDSLRQGNAVANARHRVAICYNHAPVAWRAMAGARFARLRTAGIL
jgi:hypothetical protein